MMMVARLRTACVACLLAIAGAYANTSESVQRPSYLPSESNSVANASTDNTSYNASSLTADAGTSESQVQWTDQVLTDGILNGISLAVGLCIILIGRHLPTLGGGSLVFALFVATLMKSGQEDNPDVSQWPWLPVIILLITLSFMSVLIYFLRRTVTAVVTGIVLAVAALSLTVIASLPFLSVGLPAAALCFALGYLLGWMLTNPEKSEDTAPRWFYIGLSALIGAYLLVDGCAYFIIKHDLTRDITRSVLRAGREEEIARDARPVVISWLLLSAVLPAARPVVSGCWDRYKPSMFDKNDDDNTSLKCPPIDRTVIGRGGDHV